MGKLNLQYYDIYRRDNSEMIDLYTRRNLSEAGNEELNLNEVLEKFIDTDEYKAIPTQQEKRAALVGKGQDIIAKAKSKAKSDLEVRADITGSLGAVKTQQWERLPAQTRKTLNTKYRRMMREGDLDFYDGKKYDPIKDIESYLDRKIEDETGTVMTLYQWALENAPELELK